MSRKCTIHMAMTKSYLHLKTLFLFVFFFFSLRCQALSENWQAYLLLLWLMKLGKKGTQQRVEVVYW